jgi:transposase
LGQPKSVEQFWKQYCQTGRYLPKKIGGYRRSRLEKHDQTLQRWIEAKSDLTLARLQQRCWEQLKVAIGTTALWHRLQRLGLDYEKYPAQMNRTCPMLRRRVRAGAAEQAIWNDSNAGNSPGGFSHPTGTLKSEYKQDD